MALVYPDIILSGNPDAYGIVQETHVTGSRSVQTLAELYAISDAILSPSGDNTNNDALGQIWYVSNDTTNNGSYRLKDWTNRKSAGGWDKLVVTGGELGQSGVTSVNNLTGDISIVGDGATTIIGQSSDSKDIKISTTNVVRTDGTSGVLNIDLQDGEASSMKWANLHAENSNGFSFSIRSGETGTGEFSINATEMLLIQNNVTDDNRGPIYRTLKFPNYDENNNNLDIKLECNSNLSYQGLYFSTGEVTLLASNYDHDDASDLTKAASIQLWNDNASYASKITFGIPNLGKLFTYEFDANIGDTSQQNKTIATVDYVDSKVGDVQSDRIKSANEYAVAVATESGTNGTLTLAASGESGEINLDSNNITLDGAVKFSISGEGVFRIVNKADDRDIFAISNTNDATNVTVSVGDIVNSFTWKGKTIATTDQIKTYTGTAPIVVSPDNKISINTASTITNDSTTVPTTAAVNTAIEALKTQVAGGIIYKGKVYDWEVSGEDIIIQSGERLQVFKNGYMVMLNGSGEVNGAKYNTGDYIIYSGTDEIPYSEKGWIVPIAECSFINSQDSNVAKTDEDNNWYGSNTFVNGLKTDSISPYLRDLDITGDGVSILTKDTIQLTTSNSSSTDWAVEIGPNIDGGSPSDPVIKVDKYGNLYLKNNYATSIKSEIDISRAQQIRLATTWDSPIELEGGVTIIGSGENTFSVNDTINVVSSHDPVNDTIVFSVVPTIGTGETAKTLATTDQIKTITLPEGTKQLPTDGSYTIDDIVGLLNTIAAALGAPVHS